MIVAGVAQLGFVADLLSKPTQIGYMNGLALTILIGQLPKLFGFSVDADGLIDEARGVRPGLADGKAVGAAVAVGLVSLALILVARSVAAAGPRRAGRGGRRDRRLRAPSTSPTTASRSSGRCRPGFPPFTVPDLGVRTCRCWWRARSGIAHRRAGRHDLDGVGVRRAHGPGRRRQRRDDRHRRRQRRGRVLPGLPGEHERLADGGRRAGGRQDAAHRAWSGRPRSC